MTTRGRTARAPAADGVGYLDTRTWPLRELRATGDRLPVLRGYAAVFNRWSDDLGGFIEKIEPRAFDATLASGRDVLALWNHDSSAVLGRQSAGTLEVGTDAEGLWFEVRPPATQIGRDAVTLVRRGDVKGCSFAFRVGPDGDTWGQDARARVTRVIRECTLVEISVCAFPSYPQTTVSARAKAAARRQPQRRPTAKRASKSMAEMRRRLAQLEREQAEMEAAYR